MSNAPTPSSSHDTARDLLFGLLALQNGFISRDALVAAFGAWIVDRSKPLDRILRDQGHLDADCHGLLEGLVRQHLKLHADDPEKSLASLSTTELALGRLMELGDTDLAASLGRVGAARLDPDGQETGTFLRDTTSAGGRFQVLRLHAKGGLGEVYVARDEEVHRDVALKQIKAEHAHDPQGRARFLLEAEITGGLEHPGIVPVYGLGTYDDGRPFYAMRFIKGDSLEVAIARFHADEGTQKDTGRRTLALNRLLRRFLDVCNALSYAHSRGVLHRDLKPANIMLGDYGETLVVDWGLAKAIGRRLEPSASTAAERTLRPESGSDVQPTAMGSLQGTPSYMSPEQAAGRLDELGAPSDVYSLGATLYALLTGRAPFSQPDLATLLRQVERGEFPRPCQVRSWIDPALEAVCLKAMARRQEDRYPTPRALAEDIEHCLGDEPVTARRDPLRTRSWRWVRKHRTLSTTAAAVLLISAIGLGIGLQRERLNAERITLERTEAERRLDQVMASYEDYFSGINEEVLRGRKLPPDLLESLLEKPRRFYEQLTNELTANPLPSAREREILAAGRTSLGRILWILNRHADSERENLAALRIHEALVREQPDVPILRTNLANSYYMLALVRGDLRRTKESEEAYQTAISILEPLVAQFPGETEYQYRLAGCRINVGLVLTASGRPALAEDSFARAIGPLEGLAKHHPGAAKYREYLANATNNLGLALTDLGRLKEAEQAYGKAIAAYQQLVNDYPKVPEYQNFLVTSFYSRGILLAREGRTREAEEAYGKAITVGAGLVKEQPAVSGYHHNLANAYTSLGLLLADTGRSKQGEEAHGKAIAVFQRLVAEHPDQPDHRSMLGGALHNLAMALAARRDYDEAINDYRQAIAHQRVVFELHPQIRQFRLFLSNHYQGLAEALRALGREDGAAKATSERMELWPGDPRELYNVACEFALCVPIAKDGSTRARHGDEAMAALRAAVAAGWSEGAHTARDADLNSLRGRPDFQALLARLLDRAFPADPFAR